MVAGCRECSLFVLLQLLILLTLSPSVSGDEAIVYQRLWGSILSNFARSFTLDSSNNAYITGTTTSFGSGSGDIILLKYNSSSGLLDWAKVWGGNQLDDGSGVATDSSGNVYVSGTTSSFGAGLEDVAVLKLDSNGSLLWDRTWGSNASDAGSAIAVDAFGNLFVSGLTYGLGAGGADALLLKLYSNGTASWVRTWGGSNYDAATGVSSDLSGDIYVTGLTYSFSAGGADVFLLKFNSTGNLIWQEVWGGTSDDRSTALATDASGNIYVTGLTYSYGAGRADAFLLKFDANGTLVWQRTWGGDNNDGGLGLSAGPSGNIYVAGYTASFGAGGYDAAFLNVTSNGDLVWSRTWGSGSDDLAYGIEPASHGGILLAGVAGTPPCILGQGNSTLGIPQGTVRAVSATVGLSSIPTVAANGNVIAAEGNLTYSGGQDIFLIRYGVPARPTVTFCTDPPEGKITFSGKTYSTGETDSYAIGNYSALAGIPTGYKLIGWKGSGGVSVSGDSSPTSVRITSSGSLIAVLAAISPTSLFSPSLLLGIAVTLLLTLQIRRHPHNRYLRLNQSPQTAKEREKAKLHRC